MISTIGERAWGRVECKFRQRKKNENIGPAKWLDLVKNSGSVSRSARQAPVSMGFSRQESWSGLPSPPPRNLSNPGIKLTSLMPPALAGWFFTICTTWEVQKRIHTHICIYVYIYTHTHTHTHIYIYTHTHRERGSVHHWITVKYTWKKCNTVNQLDFNFRKALKNDYSSEKIRKMHKLIQKIKSQL